MRIGILGILVAVGIIGVSGVIAVIVLVWRSYLRPQARRAGYASVGAYLRGVPRTDAEKRDAVDLTLAGLVICLLGLLFPPFLLIGLFPFFYGARKLAYASMGLGLIDDADADQPTE